MAVKKLLKILKEEDGQGLIEFFLFLPFILMMYSICLSLVSSLNASINQQKVARGYFYYKMQNNSLVPGPRRDGVRPEASWQRYGMHINIWAESFMNGGDQPKATCFKFEVPLGKKEGDSCDQAYKEKTTQYIRVATAYGICGATYNNTGGLFEIYPSNGLIPTGVVDSFACAIE
jgi:hypothetical protein